MIYKKYPDKTKVVEFSLFSDLTDTMTAISSFLGIEFNKILLLPSLNSNNLTDIKEKLIMK